MKKLLLFLLLLPCLTQAQDMLNKEGEVLYTNSILWGLPPANAMFFFMADDGDNYRINIIATEYGSADTTVVCVDKLKALHLVFHDNTYASFPAIYGDRCPGVTDYAQHESTAAKKLETSYKVTDEQLKFLQEKAIIAFVFEFENYNHKIGNLQAHYFKAQPLAKRIDRMLNDEFGRYTGGY